jgi:hypothetical protein
MKPTPEQLAKLPKWAKAYVTELENKVAGLSGLVYPAEPKPKPMERDPSLDFSELQIGWHINAYTKRIDQGCFNGVNHSNWSTTKTESQGRGVFYATKEEALLALRWEVIERFQKEMAQAIRTIENQL